MIKVSVFYPWSAGVEFDMKYYLATHMPLVEARLGAACKGINVDQGIAGSTPGAPPSFIAIVHILAESPEAFQAAFAPHMNEIMGDIPNFTKIQPTIQISEVKR
ncbi:MAG TPA: EthD family reductase [Roseiarcus sp.]|nr:EthD family reductase [Roseiarcus sp.]